METKLRKIHQIEDCQEVIEEAAELIRQGEVVAFPTETVYGLGGNGLREDAARKIYQAKGRPSDNPLILHISRMDMLKDLVSEVPRAARKAMEYFWPGPLTVILRKSEQVPECITGGLDTVAIRMPADEVARELIECAKVPIAAPSANTSGRPSPTKAEHVMDDLNGKIPLILDGGAVKVAVESTIVDFTVEPPVILRPGRITKEEMERVIGEKTVMNTSLKADDGGVPRAPGMKYKHYAPKAQMTIVLGQDQQAVVSKINELTEQEHSRGGKVGVLAADETAGDYEADEVLSVGRRADMETVMANLYDVLREFDDKAVDVIYSEGFEEEPLGEAVMNRLVKAAGHRMIRI